MSDLLNSASLVMIPSGYKEDVVYSQIPTDGSGDLSFTRASNGTRVNSAGLVEVAPWNMLSNSEEFTSGNGWFANTTGGSTATQTSNYGVAPNGTTTADRIQLALNGQTYADWVQVPTTGIIVGQVYTYSIYIKSLSGTKTILFFNDSTVNVLKTITTEWVRYEYSWTATSTTIYPRFLIDGGTSSSADLLAWGYQINIGSTAKPYFPTTDRLNVPRLTYQNGGGGCPSLLLEKQSTNLCLQSRNFQTTWTNSNVTITANSTTDVYGTTQAQKIEATGSGVHRCAQFLSTTSGSVYALSIDAKKGSTDWVMIRHDNGGSLNYFNLNTGTKGATCDASALIENVGNGWYRLTVFHTTSSSSGPELYVAKGNNDHDFTANGEYIYIDNVQYEQSSYPTSRIYTTSSSATRVADACYKTGISSLIGQTEGTIFLDFVFNGYMDSIEELSLTADSNNRIGLYTYDGTATLRAYIVASNYVPFEANVISLTIGQRYKVAFAYKSGDCNIYVNGVTQLQNSNSFTIGSTLNAFRFNNLGGTSPFYKSINQAILFPTRLTNAELASITTL